MSYPIVILYHRSPPDFKDIEGTQVNWQKEQSPNGIIPYLLDVMMGLSEDGCWISGTTDPTKEKGNYCGNAEGGFYSLYLYILPKDYSLFYDVYSKQYLWPILHQYPEHALEEPSEAFASFVKVNKAFAYAACSQTAINGTVWIHDYNLWLAPHFIKKCRPDIKVSFFFHTTFPKRKYLETIEDEKFFVQALLDCDLIGFHIPRFVNLCAQWLKENLLKENTETEISITHSDVSEELLSSMSALSDHKVVSEFKTAKSSIKFVAKPLPVKYVDMSEYFNKKNIVSTDNGLNINTKDVAWLMHRALQSINGDSIQIIFSARCDYTKGAMQLLNALHKLVGSLPEIVPFLHVDFISVPSKVSNPVYHNLGKQIKVLTDIINRTANKQVVNLIDYCLPQKELFRLLKQADICCVPSTYDGLNMLSKEFLAVRENNTGRLILSQYVGASVELDEAIIVDPLDIDDLLRGLLLAIVDNPKSSSYSIYKMKQKFSSDSDKWSSHFLVF